MHDFFQLLRNLKTDTSALKPVTMAVLGDTSTQFLVTALKGTAVEAGIRLEIWEADYDQIPNHLFDPGSPLYQQSFDYLLLYRSSQKLLLKYNKLTTEQRCTLAEDESALIREYCSTLTERFSGRIIYYNYSEINDGIYGNYAAKTPASFIFQLRKLNYLLQEYAAEQGNLFLCDLSSIQNLRGSALCFQPSVYINSDMVLSVDVLPLVAARTIDIIRTLGGQFKKCLILDLDNTLWGGIVGDDGAENLQLGHLGIGKAFTEFQYWVRKLKERGILLAVCSKNNEDTARSVFETHPEMILRLDDIAVFVANWENKADNIRYIQSVLNIGFDSMVFLDDNPFEREQVRRELPLVTVPELPADPADYISYLSEQNLFETASAATEDADRTRMYRIEAERRGFQQSFSNEDDFLQSLGMVSLTETFNSFNTPRVAQLSQRSNQFNLRTRRYTQNDIANIAADDHYLTFAFSLEDQFGDHGLIAALILEKEDEHCLFIDTWFMSCRVLKRGVEHYILNIIAEAARNAGFSMIKGEYIPTAKNEMVRNHYSDLGFKPEGGYWLLSVKDYTNKKCYIAKK
jgi:FkbH-like protein